MPGVPGMVGSRPKNGAVRRKAWQSMRILKCFTLPDLCRTSGANVNNLRKFLWRLEEHGYVAKTGGYVAGIAGEYQVWRIVKDIGPEYPMRCERCGHPLGGKCEVTDE